MTIVYIILVIIAIGSIVLFISRNKLDNVIREPSVVDIVCENLTDDESTIDNLDIINKIKLSIVNDVREHRVKPLCSIDDNEYRLLESFIDKGNVGFYSYSQGMNVPRYYIRKVKDNIKIIVFKNNEKIISFYKISYTDFLKSLIHYIRSVNA